MPERQSPPAANRGANNVTDGDKASVPERADFLAEATMTKVERLDLAKLARMRERVAAHAGSCPASTTRLVKACRRWLR